MRAATEINTAQVRLFCNRIEFSAGRVCSIELVTMNF